MWWLIPILGLVLGVYLGQFLHIEIPAMMVKYLSIGIMVSLDSVFGGVEALYEKSFDSVLMLSGFVANALLAAALTFIGDMLGLDLYYAAIFAFGVRLFGNLSRIRRHVIEDWRERDRIIKEHLAEVEAEAEDWDDDSGGYAPGHTDSDDDSDDDSDVLIYDNGEDR